MKRYFYESLKKYKRMDFSSFHTPGHKCNFNVLNKLISLDFTELLLTDSLYEATGIIKKAEDDLAKLDKVSVIGFKKHISATVKGNGEYALNPKGTTQSDSEGR